MLGQIANAKSAWVDEHDCDLEAFKLHILVHTTAEDYSHAADIVDGIPVYDGDEMREAMVEKSRALSVMSEWNRSFKSGPGIIAIRRGYQDLDLLDQVTDELSAIVADEKASTGGKGDHFAAAGANSRIWNAHEKLCIRAPKLFARYNANELTRRVSESWLGTGYQITTQVNVVHPGGKAQVAHRDYHMGFQDVETLKGFPASQHALSASLTLQGAIAHSDMPIESGPTKLLPYSQSYLPGYLAVLLPEFRELFEESYVQLSMAKGDMLFFNPATFHAAGENRTKSVQRFANLMQIGSAYGRSIEIVDRYRITLAVYNDLKQLLQTRDITKREADNVVAATAEGYPFPANLDIDSPLTGMAPQSQQDILRQALAENWDLVKLKQVMTEQNDRRRSH